MLLEGFAVTRAIHDRYHPSRRNPWTEIECGDHYARAMASYGVFLAVCGYEYHGPKAQLGFAPRLTPEDFKAAFTAAEGWGSFAQKVEAGRMTAEIVLLWGQLRLKTLSLALPPGVPAGAVQVTLDSRAVQATPTMESSRLLVTMASDLLVKAGQKLEVKVG
jgi:non-lysosomal glucosylceramidase